MGGSGSGLGQSDWPYLPDVGPGWASLAYPGYHYPGPGGIHLGLTRGTLGEIDKVQGGIKSRHTAAKDRYKSGNYYNVWS